MLLKIALIIALATEGSSYCLGRRDRNVCLLNPKQGRSRGYFKEWYYDQKTGKCSRFVFGDAVGSPDENRFSSESECNKLCRSEVPIYCFENITSNVRGRGSYKWTYISSNGQCVRIPWHGAVESGKNVFNSNHECEKKCRNPDFGPCAKGVSNWCKSMDTNWYRFDMKTHTCREMKWNECPNGDGNAFSLFYHCNQRCGRFILNKCQMPIQNMSTCVEFEPRYGYNHLTRMCEEFTGCADGGNSFPTVKACWKTCAGNSICAQDPHIGWAGAFPRYFYDINQNRCLRTYQLSSYVPGNTNIFYNLADCNSTCIANYTPGRIY
uniref:Putative salivary kunitz domain protein n=1 Tax=Ixodes ricinus TaxID=34613 RepID=A0A0K8R663_IXORI